MNIFKTAATAALLVASTSTFASTISFSSGLDDGCVGGCTLSSQTVESYIDSSSLSSDASWIQDSSSWFVSGSDYDVYEYDLTSFGDSILTSLFVTYDDNLLVTIGSDIVYDSTATSVNWAWTTVVDVFDYYTGTGYISATDTLDFYVANNGNGATGVAWTGTATSVPEPSMVIALGLGLVAFGVRRRKNTNA